MINGAYAAAANSCTSCQGLHARQGGQKRARLQGSHAPPGTALDEHQGQKKQKTTKKNQTGVNTAVVAASNGFRTVELGAPASVQDTYGTVRSCSSTLG